MKYLLLFSTLFFCQLSKGLDADTTISKTRKKNTLADTSSPKVHSPKKAAILSAVLPGLGQAYNKKYWKIPVVYAALGTCAGFFIYNREEYFQSRDAYRNKMDNDPSNDNLIPEKYRPVDPESIRRYRNGVRQYVDYSVLAFVLCWGLNVVDAAVDAHLNSFELGEDLTMHIQPYSNPVARTNGIQLTFDFGHRKNKISANNKLF
jgi:hypothetical protein